MKRFFILMCSLFAIPTMGTESATKDTPPIFPKDVVYTKISDEKHQYVIKNVYISKAIEDTLEYCPEYQKEDIPDCLEVKIDTKERRMTITTSKEIKSM